MLEAARNQMGLRQLVFASTDAVYEKYVPGGIGEPIREDEMPRKPRGWYALSKSIGEELCNGYHRTYSLPVTILRFCYVVGAGEVLDFPQFYLSKLRGTHPVLAELPNGEERLVILRDRYGRPHKKHIADVRDIVHGCVSALDKPGAIGETFQLAGPGPFTWDRIIPYLAERLEMSYVDVELEAVPTFYEYDLSKPGEVFNFQPQFDITRMIDDALAYRDGKDLGVLPT